MSEANTDPNRHIMRVLGPEYRAIEDWTREERLECLEWLVWNDGDGVWTDEDSAAEGMQPLSLERAQESVVKMLNDGAEDEVFGLGSILVLRGDR